MIKSASSLTTSFIKISNVLERVGNADEYQLYESMLNADELECLQQAQRFRNKSRKKQQKPEVIVIDPPTPAKKRGRKKKAVDSDVSTTDATVAESSPEPVLPVLEGELPPSYPS